MPNKNTVTAEDIHRINYLYYKFKQTRPAWSISMTEIANLTGWSASTVRKYIDKNWVPPENEQQYAKEDDYGPGVYLMTQQVKHNNLIKNLVKVGKSTNLNRRKRDYKTDNPLAERTNYLCCSEDRLDEYEKEFHNILNYIGEQIDNTEWYAVPDDLFFDIKTIQFNRLGWMPLISKYNKEYKEVQLSYDMQ